MRKTALLLTMVLMINSIVPCTVSAAETNAPVLALEDASGAADDSENMVGEQPAEDGTPSADEERADDERSSEDETIFPGDGQSGGEQVSDDENPGEEEETEGQEPSGEVTQDDAGNQTSDEEKTGLEEAGDEETTEAEESDEQQEGDTLAYDAADTMDDIVYTLYNKAYECPKGYLVAMSAKSGPYTETGKVLGLSYTVGGKRYEAEVVVPKDTGMKIIGFYLSKGAAGDDIVKTVEQLTMRYMVGGDPQEKIFEKTSQRIQLIRAESSMTYKADSSRKVLSDGNRVSVAYALYTGTPDKVKYAKVSVRKSGDAAAAEIAVSGAWEPESQQKGTVPDPRYETDYSMVTPYTEYIEGEVPCKETIPEGTYDLLLYQKNGSVQVQVISNYIEVTHQATIYDGGYVRSDDTFSMDNSGSKSVTIWVHGIGLSQDTVPVLYQTINGRKRSVTSELLGYEPIADGKHEGAIYCLQKYGFKNDLSDTVIRFPGGLVYDGSKKAVTECAYEFGTSVYAVNGKTSVGGILEINAHTECDAEKVMIYLAEAYAKAGESASVSISNEKGEEIVAKSSARVQRDGSGRLYAEVVKEDPGYERLRKKEQYLVTVYNADRVRTSQKFSVEEPSYHQNNLTVPDGCIWEICQVNTIPGYITGGSKGGKNVLTKVQLEELKKYGPVRYRIIKAGVVVREAKAFFGAGKAPEREKTPEELVEAGAKPGLAVVGGSVTTTDAKVAVIIPDYIRKKPSDCHYIQLTIENVYGVKETIFEKYAGKPQQVFALSYEPNGGVYSVTARMVYSAAGEENSAYNTYGKQSGELIVTLKDPYEKVLSVAGGNVKIRQDDRDRNTYNVALVKWKDAHEKYRTITNISVTQYPSGADVSSLKDALYYDKTEYRMKLNASVLNFGKLPAGQYTVRVEAAQRVEKTPAKATFTVRITQGIKNLEVSTDSARYYKETGKSIKIQTLVTAFDYTGMPIPAKDRDKLTYKLKNYQSGSGMEIDPDTGVVTVDKSFDGEMTNWVYVEFREKLYYSKAFKVTNVIYHIKSMNVSGISAEKLAQGPLKAYEIDGREIIVRDDSSEDDRQNILYNSQIQYSVRGYSVKVSKDGVISTTGKAGESVIRATLKDGSKESAQLRIVIAYDTVHLNAHYMSGGLIRLKPTAGSDANNNQITLQGGDAICLDVLGSNNRIVQNGAVKYRLRAAKGKIVDYGKITDGTKSASGRFIYVPKAADDEITLTDFSTNPVTVTVYKVSIPAFGMKAKVKNSRATVYKTGASDAVVFELTGELDYAGYTANLVSDHAKCLANPTQYQKYLELENVLRTQAAVEKIDGGNFVRFGVAGRENLPVGTYGMKLYLYRYGTELAPVSVTLHVTACKVPSVVITPKNITIKEDKKTAALKVSAKNCKALTSISVDAGYIGKTYFKNRFQDYFELSTDAEGAYVLICRAKDPASIPNRDRNGVIRYRVVDLAGITHEYTSNIKAIIK